MGTWDVGPFDNDTAADWRGDLDQATPEQREWDSDRHSLAARIIRPGRTAMDARWC
ncbi:DUF4259 domain-containing protein [Nucisporomicrobium flavum]|uniref:DUF4259 domain-containing protein n=1 Tax=Nucisporomicrobium flavum TaxID=2785915 RepID=UPI001F3DCE8A|nr:DUF4259 domain-containing protein [Nucisporomicrobium flavum]